MQRKQLLLQRQLAQHPPSPSLLAARLVWALFQEEASTEVPARAWRLLWLRQWEEGERGLVAAREGAGAGPAWPWWWEGEAVTEGLGEWVTTLLPPLLLGGQWWVPPWRLCCKQVGLDQVHPPLLLLLPVYPLACQVFTALKTRVGR